MPSTTSTTSTTRTTSTTPLFDDRDAWERLHTQDGLSPDAIARRAGRRGDTVRAELKRRGVYRPHRTTFVVTADDVDPDAFWAKVAVGDPDACWRWQGALITRDGRPRYGVVHVSGLGNVPAHRVAAILGTPDGAVPGQEAAPGTHTRHLCQDTLCVNPHHLRIGTPSENLRDACHAGTLRPGGSAPTIDAVDAWTIRVLYATGAFSYTALGERYGLTKHGIRLVVKGMTWGDIPMPEDDPTWEELQAAIARYGLELRPVPGWEQRVADDPADGSLSRVEDERVWADEELVDGGDYWPLGLAA